MVPKQEIEIKTALAADQDTPMLQLVDTHAHVHFDSYRGSVDKILLNAAKAGVGQILTVGVNTDDSRKATEAAASYESVWAAVGIHPHDAAEAEQGISYIEDLSKRPKVVAIGECGLDYFKSTSTKEEQETAMRLQVELALKRELAVIFHVRDAFDRFFEILKDYPDVRGVVHSFTGTPDEMRQAADRNLYIAVNGIATFTKVESQLEAYKSIPEDRLLLETDCPFLSPAPYRGQTNEPSRILDIAQQVSALRGQSLAVLANTTTENARRLFSL